MKENEVYGMKRKAKSTGSKSTNFSAAPKTEDIALVETALVLPKEEKEISEEEIQQAIVYSNDVTSIDFMMPQDEREILEKNLNIYEDVEKMQKVLAMAKRNKKITEDIKTLELISKIDDFTLKGLEAISGEDIFEAIQQDLKRKFEEGSPAKALKEASTALKIMMDARQEMVKGLNAKKGGRSGRIDLKFTNDSGEEFQLGVDM